jgi:hypothetical protein
MLIKYFNKRIGPSTSWHLECSVLDYEVSSLPPLLKAQNCQLGTRYHFTAHSELLFRILGERPGGKIGPVGSIVIRKLPSAA